MFHIFSPVFFSMYGIICGTLRAVPGEPWRAADSHSPLRVCIRTQNTLEIPKGIPSQGISLSFFCFLYSQTIVISNSLTRDTFRYL